MYCADIDGFEHQALFATAIRNTRDGVSLVAFYPDEPSEKRTKIIWGNSAFFEIFGGSPDELLGEPISKLRCPKTDLAAVENLHAALSRGEGYETMLELRSVGRECCAVETKVSPVEERDGYCLALCLFIDRTLQLEAEEKRQEVEAKYRALVNNSSDIFTLVDADGIIAYQSAAIIELLGFTADELTGTNCFDLVHPEDVPLARAEFQRILSSREKRTLPPLRVMCKGQPARWFEVVARNHLDDDEVGAIVLTSRDVSDRIALQEKLVVTDRLASLGLLAAGMAHELNNPLSYVISNLEYAVQTLVANVELTGGMRDAHEALGESLHGAMRIQQIVRDLRSYVREGESDRHHAEFQLENSLRSAVNICSKRITSEVHLTVEAGSGALVYGSESKMMQVCLNLLMNAADACADVRGRPQVTARIEHDDRSVSLFVEDNGSGIATEHHGKLFEPFFSTKKGRGGTGLGLFICHQIVTSMGGAISFANGENSRGTIFKVRLPLSPSVRADPPRGGRRPDDFDRGVMGASQVQEVAEIRYIETGKTFRDTRS